MENNHDRISSNYLQFYAASETDIGNLGLVNNSMGHNRPGHNGTCHYSQFPFFAKSLYFRPRYLHNRDELCHIYWQGVPNSCDVYAVKFPKTPSIRCP